MFMWVQDFYFKEVVEKEIYLKKKNVVVIFIKDDCVNDASKKFINLLSSELKKRDDAKRSSGKKIYIMKNEYSDGIPEDFGVEKEAIITAIEFNNGYSVGMVTIDNGQYIDHVLKFVL